jgi:hypothetical protein
LQVDCWPAETFLLSDDWANKEEETRVGKPVGALRNQDRLIDECVAAFSYLPPFPFNARTGKQAARQQTRFRRHRSDFPSIADSLLFVGKMPALIGNISLAPGALKIDRDLRY